MPRNAWQAVWRDAKKHRSPNAGWPEAAMAGALGLALAGPRSYGGVMVDDAFMGEGGRREADSVDIRRALKLYRVADYLLIGLFGLISAIVSRWRDSPPSPLWGGSAHNRREAGLRDGVGVAP